MKGVKGGQLKVLSTDQILDVHYATLDVLQHCGVVVRSEEGLKILDEAGADVDYKRERARIPPYLIEEAIRKTPHGFRLVGRNLGKYCKLEGDRVHFSVQGSPPHVLDLDGKRRSVVVKDFEDLVRLTDALENIDVAGAGILGMEIRVPEPVRYARNFLRRLRNTDKPCTYIAGRNKVEAMDSIRMASAVRGGLEELRRNPMGWAHVNPVSPLIHDRGLTEAFLAYAKHGLPIHFGSEVLGGATGPATLAGILAQQNAENLSGVVMAQLAASPEHRPPIIYGCVSTILDQRTGMPALGSPESALLNVASAQMAKHYEMPCRGSGGYSESKVPDGQAGYEAGITLLAVALAGANYIYAAGGLEPGMLATSYEKYVMDNESIGMIRRVLEGISVSDETLATDIISNVGPGGHFLSQKHTLRFLKEEHYFPAIFDRRRYESWVEAGSKSTREVARERAKEILEKHRPEPLDEDMEKEIREMIREIEERESKRASSPSC